MDDLKELIEDVVRMLGRKNIPEATVLADIKDAVMKVLADGIFGPRVNPSITAAVPATPTLPVGNSGDGGVPVTPATVPATPAASQRNPSAYFKGTGKHVMIDGARVELGTWVDPIGEQQAADLTKKTGVTHYVNPKTGIVESLGALPTAALAAAAEVSAPTAPPVLVVQAAESGALESIRK